ncbi:MAG: methyltransferase domain-containing protein [Anderseniella sp.]|jgi:SAM-dependent methyltransferase|nr:methyltransferase domain-containing protein [Anderseniella sp.]
MTDTVPALFDQPALARNLARAHAQGCLPPFWETIAAAELADRLQLIKRQFARIGLISFSPAGLEAAIRPALKDGAEVISLPVLDRQGLTLEYPRLEPESLDCLLVTAGLEWVNDLPGTLSLLRRALKPDGVLLAAMLGGETFAELRQAWLAAEAAVSSGASPRVAPFVDVRDAGGLLQRAGLAMPVADTDRLAVRYADALSLMRELKSLGLANALSDRRRGLTPPALLAAACAAYHDVHADADGRVRATVQLLYLTGWSPHESQQKPLRPGSAKASLADALKVSERKLPRG